MAPPLQQLIELWQDLQHPRVLWQVSVIVVALLAAWLSALVLERRLARADASGAVNLGQRALRELIFPLVALGLVLLGRTALHNVHGTAVLNVAVALLTALAILRFALLLVRQVFAPSPLLQGMTRLIGWTVWLGFALHITGLAPEVLNVLEEAHIVIGRQRISVLLILQAALSVATAVLIALWLGRYAETRLMAAESVQVSLRVMLTKLAKALFVLLAVLIALPAVGIDITALSVFGGMLGVGIGFGLQKIASNYVSGFIILMDRSVSIGDVVTIEQHTGRVTKMTARYVVLRNPAGTEALIPNETLIGSTVINHTYTDRRVHVPVGVQVAYETDMERASSILEGAARGHPRVLSDPAPRVLVKELADSGVNLELGVWIDDPEDGIGNVRSDLYFEILRRFGEAGIEIPYPQRELRMRPVATAASPETPFTTKA
ncbi:MAG: mechanosensitive ion channel family protein [Rhodospirillaceae bacterium]